MNYLIFSFPRSGNKVLSSDTMSWKLGRKWGNKVSEISKLGSIQAKPVVSGKQREVKNIL